MSNENYILMGPPGCGKGTQASLLCKSNHLFHISSGDLLREVVTSESELGKEVKSYLNKGILVSDEIILKIMEEKILEIKNKQGFILDGFPRTLSQAIELDHILKDLGIKITKAFYFEISEQLLVKRICGRLIHPGSGRVYHKEFSPPLKEGIDDVTNEPLIVREDDKPETLKKRLQEYNNLTVPVLKHYSDMGLLIYIDASTECDRIFQEIIKHINTENPMLPHSKI